MVSKKRVKRFDFSNKLAYTLIAFAFIIGLGIGVYAYGGTAPSTMGHSTGEIAPPSSCSSNQVLTWTGSAWSCTTVSSTDSRFTIGSSGLCYNAPVTCSATTTTSCSYTLSDLVKSYGSSCTSATQTELDNFCVMRCQSEGMGTHCIGDTSTSCSGGTSSYFTAATGTCLGTTVSCDCYSPTDYSVEHYTPAGTRCI